MGGAVVMRRQSTQSMGAHCPHILLDVSVCHHLVVLPFVRMLQRVGATDHWGTEVPAIRGGVSKKLQWDQSRDQLTPTRYGCAAMCVPHSSSADGSVVPDAIYTMAHPPGRNHYACVYRSMYVNQPTPLL